MAQSIKISHILASFVLFYGINSMAYAEQEDLLNLSVEDLLNVKVTSVSKKAQALNDSPAAVFVITQEDIKRIGATSIPEALRLAPGVDVARVDGNKWAVSIRGFNSRFANKLLVLIDGRSIYTRTFSGVYWENQDVVLEDVDRIEVIRGPGATLWGANAVNGVINIITKNSRETQGGLLVAGGGNQEKGFGAFRYGGQLSQDTTGRAYIKGFKRGENTLKAGGDAGDDWDRVQAGFRVDSQLTLRDDLTVQGDIYHSNINQYTNKFVLTPPYQKNFDETINTYGGNLLARHQHIYSSVSDYTVQVYFDYYQRDEDLYQEDRYVLDLDFQHHFALNDWNDVIWGGGYRYSYDDLDHNPNNNLIAVNPGHRNDQLVNLFVQDEITVIEESLWLILGSKFEHNDYSGFEVQPTARFLWIPHPNHRVWGAVSRAVRTPSRADTDAAILVNMIPPNPPVIPAIAVFVEGQKNFKAEDVVTYELGYRTSFNDQLSVDITFFYNHYDNLRAAVPQTAVFDPAFGGIRSTNVLSNPGSLQTYGFEIATVWQMLDYWRWDANYSLLKTDFNDALTKSNTPESPQQRVSLRSIISPTKDVDLDFVFRYVDKSIAIGSFDTETIKAYISLDVRMAWRPVNGLELSLVGQNLLAQRHQEYREESFTQPTEIDRSFYGKLSWHF
jgi:iron complex outermembrane receptor protein